VGSRATRSRDRAMQERSGAASDVEAPAEAKPRNVPMARLCAAVAGPALETDIDICYSPAGASL
jgi:hypothetical protein